MNLLPNVDLHCQDRDGVQVRELATGLWYWTGLHPDWSPEDGGPEGWEREVGCYYYEAPDAVVLFDPLVPPEDEARFHEALERDVRRAGRPVRILLTADSHRRSSKELAERHGGSIGEVPAGVEAALSVWDELVFWIPEHGALVFGDVVLGREGGLRLPRSWIDEERYAEVVDRLRALLDLPVERALVTHGEPILSGAHGALERALET
jgi:glyoxylase-like metal-dependent hydrolase (beta-lactamase superfamily II)